MREWIVDWLPALQVGADPFVLGAFAGALATLVAVTLFRIAHRTSAPLVGASSANHHAAGQGDACPRARSESTTAAPAPSFWPGVKELGRMFRRWDADKDGRLSLAEFQVIC